MGIAGMRPSRTLLAITLFAWSTSNSGIGAQTAGAQNQPVTLESAAGKPTGRIRMPASPARPPIVMLLAQSEDEASTLAAALAGDGVASLRPDGAIATPDTSAQWIALLRNDPRFPTVSVFGEGAALTAAVVAARAARADGLVTRGDSSHAADEIARVVAEIGTASDAAGIAAFARSVAVLGRRGTSAARPATARRSPRQVLMTMVGSVRVSIEWGSPQKRGRDVWGGLVPWNAIWMPGADEASVITTSGPLTIGTIEVPAGDYTLYTWPSADRVQLIVSRDVGQFHTVHEERLFLGRVDMTAGNRPDSVEGLTFAIEARDSAGTLKLIWDTREYATTVTAR